MCIMSCKEITCINRFNVGVTQLMINPEFWFVLTPSAPHSRSTNLKMQHFFWICLSLTRKIKWYPTYDSLKDMFKVIYQSSETRIVKIAETILFKADLPIINIKYSELIDFPKLFYINVVRTLSMQSKTWNGVLKINLTWNGVILVCHNFSIFLVFSCSI